VRHPSILREGAGMGTNGQCEALKKPDLSTRSLVFEPGLSSRGELSITEVFTDFPTPGRRGSYFFHCRKSKQKVQCSVRVTSYMIMAVIFLKIKAKNTAIALVTASIFNAEIRKKNNISLSSLSGQST
jgi:hypothetical protein